MVVTLTPELERRLAQRVASGLYLDASEVMREALRHLFAADEPRIRLPVTFGDEGAPEAAPSEREEAVDAAAARLWIRARFEADES